MWGARRGGRRECGGKQEEEMNQEGDEGEEEEEESYSWSRNASGCFSGRRPGPTESLSWLRVIMQM